MLLQFVHDITGRHAAEVYTLWVLSWMSHVAAGHEAWLVNAVVDSFTESHSIRCLEILAGMNEPHDKVWCSRVMLYCCWLSGCACVHFSHIMATIDDETCTHIHCFITILTILLLLHCHKCGCCCDATTVWHSDEGYLQYWLSLWLCPISIPGL